MAKQSNGAPLAADFSFIGDAGITGTETARFIVPEVLIDGAQAFLMLAPATEQNEPFWLAAVAHDTGKLKALGPKADDDVSADPDAVAKRLIDNIADLRTADVKLFADHIVKDWGRIRQGEQGLGQGSGEEILPMMDGNGVEVECTPENVMHFLEQVRKFKPGILDLIRNFARDIGKYRPAPEIKALTGNLSGG